MEKTQNVFNNKKNKHQIRAKVESRKVQEEFMFRQRLAYESLSDVS